MQTLQNQKYPLFEKVLACATSQLWIANSYLEMLFMNTMACGYHGVAQEQLSGHGWMAFIHPDDLQRVIAQWKQYQDDKTPRAGQLLRLRNVAGEYRWHWCEAQCEFDDEGQARHWIGCNTDVHDVKQLQTDLQANLLAMERSGTPVLHVDARGRINYASSAAQDLLGMSTMAQCMTRPLYSLFKYPDLAAWGSLWQQLLLGDLHYDEALLQAPLKPVTPVALSLSLINPEVGEAFAVCVLQDQRNQRENERNQKVAQTVYMNSAQAMLVLDANFHVTSVNPAFSRTTHYSLDGIKNQGLEVFLKPDSHTCSIAKLQSTICQQGKWEGEILCQTQEGHQIEITLNLSAVMDRDGRLEQVVGIFTDISERKQLEREVWKQANFDDLTNLPNRRLFSDRLNQEIKKTQRDGSQLALLFVDLDGFKDVNDDLGHIQGDNLLIQAANRISQCVRDSDTLARLGGDEFTIILPHIQNKNDAVRVAEKVLAAISAAFPLEKQTSISASVGVAFFPVDANNTIDLLRAADQAMYTAKESGKGCYAFYKPR